MNFALRDLARYAETKRTLLWCDIGCTECNGTRSGPHAFHVHHQMLYFAELYIKNTTLETRHEADVAEHKKHGHAIAADTALVALMRDLQPSDIDRVMELWEPHLIYSIQRAWFKSEAKLTVLNFMARNREFRSADKQWRVVEEDATEHGRRRLRFDYERYVQLGSQWRTGYFDAKLTWLASDTFEFEGVPLDRQSPCALSRDRACADYKYLPPKREDMAVNRRVITSPDVCYAAHIKLARKLVAHQFEVISELIDRRHPQFHAVVLRVGDDRHAFNIFNRLVFLDHTKITINPSFAVRIETADRLDSTSSTLPSLETIDRYAAPGATARFALLYNLACMLGWLFFRDLRDGTFTLTPRTVPLQADDDDDGGGDDCYESVFDLPRRDTMMNRPVAPEFCELIDRLASGRLTQLCEVMELLDAAFPPDRTYALPETDSGDAILSAMRQMIATCEHVSMPGYARAEQMRESLRHLHTSDWRDAQTRRRAVMFGPATSGHSIAIRSRLERNGIDYDGLAHCDALEALAHAIAHSNYPNFQLDCGYAGEPAFGPGVTREIAIDAIRIYVGHECAIAALDPHTSVIELRSIDDVHAGVVRCRACEAIAAAAPEDERIPHAQRLTAFLAALEFLLSRALTAPFFFGAALLSALAGFPFDDRAIFLHAANYRPEMSSLYHYRQKSRAVNRVFSTAATHKYKVAYETILCMWSHVSRVILHDWLSDSLPSACLTFLSLLVNGCTFDELAPSPSPRTDDTPPQQLTFEELRVIMIASVKPVIEEPGVALALLDNVLKFSGRTITVTSQKNMPLMRMRISDGTTGQRVIRELLFSHRNRERLRQTKPELPPINVSLLDAITDFTTVSARARAYCFLYSYILSIETLPELLGFYGILFGVNEPSRLVVARARRALERDADMLVSFRASLRNAMHAIAGDSYECVKTYSATLNYEPMIAQALIQSAVQPTDDQVFTAAIYAGARSAPWRDTDALLPSISTCSRAIHLSPLHSYDKFAEHMALLRETGSLYTAI